MASCLTRPVFSRRSLQSCALRVDIIHLDLFCVRFSKPHRHLSISSHVCVSGQFSFFRVTSPASVCQCSDSRLSCYQVTWALRYSCFGASVLPHAHWMSHCLTHTVYAPLFKLCHIVSVHESSRSSSLIKLVYLIFLSHFS